MWLRIVCLSLSDHSLNMVCCALCIKSTVGEARGVVEDHLHGDGGAQRLGLPLQLPAEARLEAVVNIITRTAHYERFAMSGAGFMRSDRL